MITNMDVEIFNIFGAILSTAKSGRKRKAITIVSAKCSNLEQTEIFADIRVYKNGLSIDKGVYLSEKEYNWICNQLKNGI